MKKLLSLLSALTLCPQLSHASDDGQSVFNMLNIPVSAHATAVGGDIISLTDDDAQMMFMNPALLTHISDNQISMGYMNYMEGIKRVNACYNKSFWSNSSLGFSADVMDYGKILRTSDSGVIQDSFSAKDLAIGVHLGYLLWDNISIGLSTKLLSSNIAENSSLAIGADLGINYNNDDNGWSLSLVARNLGGQLSSYTEDYEPLPFNMLLGISKRLGYSPLRINATLADITHTNYSFKEHLIIGADIIITPQIWVGAGYNFRHASERLLAANDKSGSHGAGISLGAGVNMHHFGMNISWAKEYVCYSSLRINISYKL